MHDAGNEGVIVGLGVDFVNVRLGAAECDDLGCSRDVPVGWLVVRRTVRGRGLARGRLWLVGI